MRKRFALVTFVLASLASSAFAAASAPTNDEGFGGNIGLVIGQKTFHKSDFGNDFKDQPGIQLMTTWGVKSVPVMLAFDVGYNTKTKTLGGTKITATETEFSLGARAPIKLEGMPIRPYIGLGIEDGMLKTSGGGTSLSASGLGIWGDGGAQFMLGALGVGIDLRYDGCPVKGKYMGFDLKSDVGGFMPGLAISYSF